MDVVGMTFPQARLCDPYQATSGTQGLHIAGTGIAHSRAQASSHLADEITDGSGVADTSLDAFWDVLSRCLTAAITIGGSASHGSC